MPDRTDILAALLVLGLIGMARSDQPRPDRPGPVEAAADLQADVAYPDVYINDSFEASDAISRAAAYAQRRQWRRAAEVLQAVADQAPDQLIRVEPGYYVGVRAYINRIICSWPADALSVYRELYEPQIRAGIERAQKARSASALLPWFDRYFCTAAAAGLADRIAQLAIEAGDMALAERLYTRVLAYHPDAAEYQSNYSAMLHVISAVQGRTGTEPTDPIRETALRWMGRDRKLGEVLAEIEGRFPAFQSPTVENDWPIFGGAPDRNRRRDSDVDDLGLLWRFVGFRGPDDSAEPDVADPLARVYRHRANSLTIQPVVAGGTVIVQRVREIVALHRNTGVASWWFRADLPGSSGLAYVDEPAPVWDSVTVHDGRVYASLPGETVPYYSYESAGSPPELACLDAETGHAYWRVDQRAIEEEFAETTFDTSPIVQQDRLYVVGRRRRSFGFEDCYLYRFSAKDGALQQRTHLGSASTGTFGSQSPTLTAAALDGDTIYVCTNLGSIAAVDGHTGAVRWLRLYQRREADAAQGANRYPGNAKPWRLNPLLFSDGRIVALPTDADDVLVLSASDGDLLQSIPVETFGHCQTLLGVDGDVLCGVGREAACYDLAAGKLRWSSPLPEGTELYGRGVWTHDRLLVPTREWISTYDVNDGRRNDAAWESGGEGGNLVALRDQILVAGPDRVSAYVRKAEIWQALRARVDAAPSDPLPALELAEVALSNSELTEAIRALRETVRRTELSAEALSPALSRRISDYLLVFSDRVSSEGDEGAELAEELLRFAPRFAPDPAAHLAYRFRFAQLLDSVGKPERAVVLYQQILRDRTLRTLPLSEGKIAAGTAAARAQAEIAALIERHGRGIYAPYDTEAEQWFIAGRAGAEVETLRRVVETFPNSLIAPKALVAEGEILSRHQQPERAAVAFTHAYHRYPSEADRPALLRRIADAYERAGEFERAYRWLTKAAVEHPGVRFDHEGRQVGFLDYRTRLAHVRDRVEPSRPTITLPLRDRITFDLDEKAALLTPRFGDHPGFNWSVCFVRSPEGVRAFDPGTGRKTWTETAPVNGSANLLFATSDRAIFATPDELFALDLPTGKRRWTHAARPLEPVDPMGDWEDLDTFQTHAIHGTRLLSVKSNGDAACANLDTGDIIWSQTLRPAPSGTVGLGDRWVTYHVVQDDRVVVCFLDAPTGDWAGAIMTDERRAVEALFETLDGRLILVTSQSVSCLDPLTHGLRWRVGVR
ncbi:MAG: PQQ-binding-like beta-propeller repeat protein, partial [Phycisphaerae bacterium]